jgi:hypothetical protein
LLLRELKRLYHFHFRDERRERLFLSSLAFFLTFGVIRLITHMIRANVGPFHNVTASNGLHIHHLVWGILLLLVVAYVWLLEVGVGSSWVASITAGLFGVGAALTLDEFALFLNLKDVYWEQQGRVSVDAVLIFGAALSIGVWGWPFFRDVASLLRHKPASGGAT